MFLKTLILIKAEQLQCLALLFSEIHRNNYVIDWPINLLSTASLDMAPSTQTSSRLWSDSFSMFNAELSDPHMSTRSWDCEGKAFKAQLLFAALKVRGSRGRVRTGWGVKARPQRGQKEPENSRAATPASILHRAERALLLLTNTERWEMLKDPESSVGAELFSQTTHATVM